jgi:hypothetical protein
MRLRMYTKNRVKKKYSLTLHLVPISLSKTPRPEFASEIYRPSYRRLWAKLVPTFSDRGCHVVCLTDPYGRILGFIERSRYVFFQIGPQLYSRGWWTPFQTLLLRKSGSAGNRIRTSGSVARNSDHLATEAVCASISAVKETRPHAVSC